MKRFAVMGDPINHSLSPEIHQQFAQQFNIALNYEKLQVSVEKFPQAVSDFFQQGGDGLNITVPLKEHACALVDKKTPRAQAAGSVNTIYQQGDMLIGDNTDGVGLLNALRYHHVDITNKTILVIGAGGAARAVLAALVEHVAATKLTLTNRTLANAEKLLSDLKLEQITLLDAPLIDKSYDLIINTAAAGLSNGYPKLNPQVIEENNTVLYDCCYGKAARLLLNWAVNYGATVFDGWSMLVEQAAEAFYIWHGVRPATSQLMKTAHA